jgi:hypothetical protein
MDLPTAHGATILTAEQIKALVECDEDPATWTRSSIRRSPSSSTAAPAKQVAWRLRSAAKPAVQAAKPAAKPAVVAAPAPVADVEDAEEASFSPSSGRQPREGGGCAAAAVKAAAPAPKAEPTPAVSIDEMDPDLFIEEFGDPSK